MGSTYSIYGRRKDNEQYVLIIDNIKPQQPMDVFKHHVAAYACDKKHVDKQSLYLYKGYVRQAKAIIKSNYLELTFNSSETSEIWDASVERVGDVPWLFRDFARCWKPVNVEHLWLRVYQKR